MAVERYLVATAKPWNIDAFRRRSPAAPGEWTLLTERAELTADRVARLAPRFVFVPHWSWKIPDDVLRASEFVLFHCGDLPAGRGGSPVQNLIASGAQATMVSALQPVTEIDAGPIYAKRPLSLEGSAQTIFLRMADVVWDLIEHIIAARPTPIPQTGVPSLFKRRRPEQSVLPREGSLEALYDHIRMLDAETYPRAFLEHGPFRIEFRDAEITDGEMSARVAIRRTTEVQR